MKTILDDNQRWPLAALISLAAHLVLFAIPAPPQNIAQQKTLPPLEVETISPEKLQQYRSVGIKNGSRHFSVPIPKPSPTSPLSLQSLRQPTPAPLVATRGSAQPFFNPSSPGGLSHPSDTSILQRSDLDIQFDPPEGVSEDELNDAEKTFWSFRKRVYQTFASSVLSTYRRLLLKRPQLQKTIKKVENQHMAGKMVFDENGDILRIKMIRLSESDDLQLLFENSLRNIHKIPNPPQGLLSRDRELTLYYQLIINRR